MIDSLRSFCVKVWPVLLFGLVLSNFFLSCSAYRSASPREYRYYTEITNNLVSTASVPLPSVPASPSPVSTNSVSSASDPVKPSEFSLPYTFMILSGAPCIRFCGQYYYEGDIMSRGRIFRIFPDRVFLQTGDVIVNSSYSSSSSGLSDPSSKSVSPPKLSPPKIPRLF